MGVATSDVKMK